MAIAAMPPRISMKTLQPLLARLLGCLFLSAMPVSAAAVNATYTAATTVPVTTASFTATGNTVNFTLNFAPPVGTNLTVVKITGLGFIGGTFDNLAHGQAVSLSYGGISYPFVANYFGGTGNDLVLQWSNNRLAAWGSNAAGQLGIGVTTASTVPVATDMTGVLAGKIIVAISSGSNHCLALGSDGTLASWGDSSYGQAGNGNTTNNSLPVLVDRTGVLAGKTVVAVATGNMYCLALCSDGSVAGWGQGDAGQLGNGSMAQSNTPVLANKTGVLAGKTVVAIAAGGFHALALCADGTMAAWGYNGYGALGNNSTSQANSPVLVNQTGVLAGKTVVAIAAGTYHSLALCSDGTLAAWGYNTYGQLGNNSTTNALVPVAVDLTGVLAGKTVNAIAAGGNHNLALGADGTLAAWGYDTYGQLGNNSTTQSPVPVAVDRTGVLSGKTVVDIAAGPNHSFARCADGVLASWGYNNYGQLGNAGTTNSGVPVAVNTGSLTSGERFAATDGGTSHSCAMVATPPPPLATTLAATAITDTGATLNGSVSAQGNPTTVSFEYGLTTSYGATIAATPASLSGTAVTAVAAMPGGLTSGSTWHYRISAVSVGGTTKGDDLTFTTSTVASLASLVPGSGALQPSFDGQITNYALTVPSTTTTITMTPGVLNAGATVTVNGVSVASGAASGPLNLTVGNNLVPIKVTAAGGIITQTYTVTVTRLPSAITYNSATVVPVTVSDLNASGMTATFALNFAPATGANLTVVKNTGMNPIRGAFDNLPQGQRVNLTYAGITYGFVANYYGGTGNDLVLQWANNRLLAWGANTFGQLGMNHVTQGNVAAAVTTTGALAGKTILTVAAGGGHSLALCADGTLAAWGYNSQGQLGTNGASQANVPELVDRTGALAGKTVVAVSAGLDCSLALCSDGTMAAWGINGYGQLGNGGTATSRVPVPVDMSGVLAGKTVIAISSGYYFCLALCSDGTLAAWGDNSTGQLGNNSTIQSKVPVLVDRSGVLAGKTVIAISAGGFQCLALCSDGALAVWGANNNGGLGIGKQTANSMVPVMVDRTGVLAGKSLVAISGGGSHSLVLCSDGSISGWGNGDSGQLGNGGGKTVNPSPLAVTQTGVLAGKTVIGIAAGRIHSLALCEDGTLSSWGNNQFGQLGNNSTTTSNVPVLVNTGALKTGELIVAGVAGTTSLHNLALVASVPPPLATTLAATGVSDTGATLQGTVNANGTSTAVSFEYGLTTSYGTVVTATPANLTGTAATAASATPGGLLSGLTYHYRVVATSSGGTVTGEDMTFTTTTLSGLASLTISAGTLSPGFAVSNTGYIVTVSNGTSAITVTPVASYGTSTIKVNGTTVASGTASAPLNLAVGNTAINVVVTATGGTKTYTLTVTRLPAVFAFSSATTVPVTVGNGFAAAGNAPAFSLTFAPVAGTNLIIVKNTGLSPIQGTFANLVHGQRVDLTYGGFTYSFIANYYGGTGNDLVLQWANTRLLGWGVNAWGQSGAGNTTSSRIPVATDMTGVLAQKTIVAAATGSYHDLVLCSDGTLAAWGGNDSGQLGNATTTSSSVPVRVDMTGVLAGKTVIAIGSGYSHCLALCSDGTLAVWGSNYMGQFGNNTFTSSTVPVLVNRTGVLAGKTIIAIAAGSSHSLALCADGTLAAWGSNSNGQLGNNISAARPVPELVDRTGVLSGKTVTAISAGSGYNLATCSDGNLAGWGRNNSGQLGNNTTTDSWVPVLVDKSGVLAGKTITTAAAGSSQSLALCADGTLAAWGSGYMGDGATTTSKIPVFVSLTGVLAGKTVTSVAAGIAHSLALCADGTLAAWGYNYYAQLGDNTSTTSNLPVLVNTSALRAGERIITAVSGDSYSDSEHSLAIVASPPRPAATTLAASAISETGATLNATVNANSTTASVSFQYGLTSTYGTTVAAVPASVTGTGDSSVSFPLGGLAFGTTYHYRVVASNSTDTGLGDDMTFTTAAFATLANLALGDVTLVPEFSSSRLNYFATVPYAINTTTVTPLATDAGSTITVDGIAVASGVASDPIALAVGNTMISTTVTSADGFNTKTYTVIVTRLPDVLEFQSADNVPVTVGDFAAAGNLPPFALNYAPVVGTNLTIVRNTGYGPIQGTFGNLSQGQWVQLTYGGVTYSLIADYYGGTGNDLVLQWANTRMWAWGDNFWGQLGNNSTTSSSVPVPVVMTGVFAGKTVTAAAVGSSHSLALCVDGSVAAWGMNNLGAFGNGSSSSSSGPLPVLTDRSGVLAGKRVTAVAAGNQYSLALCSDGTMAAWGYNSNGSLGNNSTTNSYVPVLVDRNGALFEKSVIAISATNYHNLALCSDGTVVAWGYNASGQLGNNSTTTSKVPAVVDMTGVLASKQVTAIAAGSSHSLVLCADGTLAAWGSNASGQLGNNSTTNSSLPVLVDRTGVLAGKTITAISAGSTHCLALCSDGTLAAWGGNTYGEVGDNTTTRRLVPVRVSMTGALADKTIRMVSTGDRENLALFTDGTLAAWGRSNSKSLPTVFSTSTLAAGEQIVAGSTGSLASHRLALAATPPPPGAVTLAASAITHTLATLNGSVIGSGVPTSVSFEYGLTPAYGSVVTATQSPVGATGSTAVSAPVGGLISGTTYHYRVIATNSIGTAQGADLTFTTGRPPVFFGYAFSTPYQTAATVSLKKLLAKASDPDGDAISVTGAAAAATQGGTVVLLDTGILYTPPAGFTGTDTFAVILTDAGGAATTGTVTVTVGPAATAGGSTVNPPRLTPQAGGRMGLKFQGIPGRSYQIQRSPDMAVWTPLATVTANATGAMTFTDENPPQPNAFYRLALP